MKGKLIKLITNPNKTKQTYRKREWLSHSDENAKYKWISTIR